MRKLVIGTAVALSSLAVAGTAQADTFDDFNVGSVDDQHGWIAKGDYDHEIVDIEGDKKFRVSNARTSGSFDMPYSTPTAGAGEQAAFNTITNEFSFASATGERQPGLALSVSPTGEGGSRQSYVRLEDSYDGMRVFFVEYPNVNGAAAYTDRWIATVNRNQHNVKFVTTFVPGTNNDVVRVFIDGEQKVCGTSWENYYRFYDQKDPVATDRLMWRIGGTAAPATEGDGFLFDNVTTTVSNEDAAACTTPPADGADGAPGRDGEDGVPGNDGRDGTDGKNGTNGVDGKNGVNGTTTVIREPYTIIGASMRTLHIRKIAGMKFIKAKATLSGKKLSVKGRTIKVNLRGKSAGEYRVHITAKYKANGKVYKVRSIRSLSIIRK